MKDHVRPSAGVALALLLLAGVGFSRAADTGYEPFTYRDAAGNTIPYRLLRPQNEDATQRYPLVLFLHGAGERGADNERQLIHGTRLFLQPDARKDFPCFVLAPQCPAGQRWVEMDWSTDSGARPPEPSGPMRLALGALDEVLRQNRVDTNRLYVTGLSMGGYGTWDCATRFPDRFAAAAPVCDGGDDKSVTPAVARVPVWAFHSEDDATVKVIRSQAMVQAFRNAGGQPKYFEYFGLGHNSWDAAYAEPEFLPWMFAQRRGEPSRYVLKTPAPELPSVARWPESDDLFPGQGPLQKADWFQKLWRQRRAAWWMRRQQDRGAVVFVGDSITDGWQTLAKDFPGLQVANRGISGDVTRGVRYRLKEDVVDLEPKAVVLLIGTNDLGLQGEPETAAENIRILLDAFQVANPRLPVIVCKVMPRQPGLAAKVQRLNELVDALVAASPQCVRCDTWSLFADDQGGAKQDEFPDLLHPNAAGYAKWAEALRSIFAKLGFTP